MKEILRIFVLLVFLSTQSYSQAIPNCDKIQGIWKFIPPEDGYDSIYTIFSNRKSVKIYYVKETNNTFITGSPYSYYGFWDDSNEEYPKKVTELKSSGNRVLFFDDLCKSHDSLGNLIKYTRSCYLTYSIEGDDEAEMPSDYTPNRLFLNFTGRDPDVYERIREIPLFVIESLRNNKKDWEKYRLFVDFKKINKKVYLNIKLNQPTKMYLLKGDEVEVLEEQDDWLRIRYYGKKTIEGWIKRSDVE